MSEILARIRVRETSGIRRFLYPLKVVLKLPLEASSAFPKRNQLSLVDIHGKPVPFEKSPIDPKAVIKAFRSVPDLTASYLWTLYFAVFLSPFEEAEFRLTLDELRADLDDPLQLDNAEGSVILAPTDVVRSTQKRLVIALTPRGQISEIVYDGISHLRGETAITSPSAEIVENEQAWDFSLLMAWVQDKILYTNSSSSTTHTEISACKSWATITYKLDQPQPNDEIVFTLPLAITSSTLTCDFGVGGYVFGKLNVNAPEIVWHTEFGDAPYAKWTVATAGRVDYIGEVETAEAFLPQRWFHLIDSDKALAVAITKLPEGCQSMTVRLTHKGDVSIAFKLGDAVTGPAEFGICYHFLNDVPAIAAATNPQSILLPPIVEVLPLDLLHLE